MKRMKRCSRCGEEKPLEEFPASKFSKDGRFHYCKECWNRYHREYYWKNIKKMREYLRTWMRAYRKKAKRESRLKRVVETRGGI